MYWGFFENALEGFFQTTPEGQYLRANPGLARIYGYESPEAVVAALTNISTQLYVDPNRRAEFSRLMREAGEVIGFESEVYRNDGSVIWILENARVVPDEHGNTLHYEGTVQDITARKRAEAELGASQRFIERVAQSSPNILYVYDLKQRRYIYANNRVYELLGHKPEFMTSIGTEFLHRFLHPDDVWLLEQRIRDLSQAEDGEVFEYEYRLLNCDGEWRWINARETIFTRMTDGEPHEIIGTAQDITERKYAVEALLQSEERFRQLVEGADAMFWERDLTGETFTYVGPQAERLLGFPIENWFTPDFWLSHIHPEDRERARQFWQDAATRGTGSQTIEYQMHAANHRPVWVREFGHLSRGKRGALVLQGIMINITERQLARSEIQRSHRQLRALSARLQTAREEERTHIAREIHDELGGALTALKVDVNKIKAECTSQEEEEKRAKLVERFAGVMDLIDRTMEGMRRLATELRPPILDAFGIVAAIEWQVTEFEKRFGVRCELANGWHSPIVHDTALSTALFRIFQELLTNVARHSKASHVSVRLAEDGTHLTLSVMDNGRGITEGERRDALGLLGMQERALMFGGEVTIERAPKKGTLATVRIPIQNIVSRIDAPKKERLWP